LPGFCRAPGVCRAICPGLCSNVAWVACPDHTPRLAGAFNAPIGPRLSVSGAGPARQHGPNIGARTRGWKDWRFARSGEPVFGGRLPVWLFRLRPARGTATFDAAATPLPPTPPGLGLSDDLSTDRARATCDLSSTDQTIAVPPSCFVPGRRHGNHQNPNPWAMGGPRVAISPLT